MGPLIDVLLFEPGHGPRFVQVREDHLAFRELLRTDGLDTTFFLVGDRFYALWADDFAYEKGLPANGVLVGGSFRGWVMRGPYFISRVRGACDTSVDESDLSFVCRFVRW